MSVIGVAKNARLKVTVGTSGYTSINFRSDGTNLYYAILRKSTTIATMLKRFPANALLVNRVMGFCGSYEIEAINDAIKISGYASTDCTGTPIDTVTVTDSSLQVAGNWEITTAGITVISFEILDVTNYTVSYDANGGSVSPTSAVYSGTALTLPTPTRTGYTFNGWYTAATGGTLVNSPYTPSANVTLYAQWTANPTGLPLYIGSQQVQKVYIGNQDVTHMYLGNTLIF